MSREERRERVSGQGALPEYRDGQTGQRPRGHQCGDLVLEVRDEWQPPTDDITAGGGVRVLNRDA